MQPTTGVHLYGQFLTSNGSLVAQLYGDTPSAYTDAGPDAITSNLLTLDPYLLPYQSGSQAIDTTTISAFPANRQQLMLVNPSATQTEGIAFYLTEDANGVASINKFTFTKGTTGLNGAFTIVPSASPVESGLIGDHPNIFHLLATARALLMASSL